MSDPTPDQVAEQVLNAYAKFDGKGEYRNNYAELVRLIADALTTALDAEREECLTIHKTHCRECPRVNGDCEEAAAIRARRGTG